MAQGCISVIEMTVMLGFMQQNPRRGVMAKGKKIAPVRCVEGGAGVLRNRLVWPCGLRFHLLGRQSFCSGSGGGRFIYLSGYSPARASAPSRMERIDFVTFSG